MPLQAWIDLHETNDLRHLLLRPYKRITSIAISVYDRLKDELIDTFGVSIDFTTIMNNEIEIQRLMVYGDESDSVFIERLSDENEKIKSRQKNTDFFNTIIILEEALKRDIDAKKVTVYQFYKFLEYAKSKSKKKSVIK